MDKRKWLYDNLNYEILFLWLLIQNTRWFDDYNYVKVDNSMIYEMIESKPDIRELLCNKNA